MHTHELLSGKTIIVTRPLAQAKNMCESLERNQATVVHFPVISITAVKKIKPAKNALKKLRTYDVIIFISANAVHYAMDLVQQLSLSFKDKQLAAVGPATKMALESYGHSVSIVPMTGFTSEALLNHDSLQKIVGQKILIIRGHGGRERLRQELESRGAEVSYAEVYQRRLPVQRNTKDLSELSKEDTAILINSVESVQNLWSLCSKNEQQWLTNATFIVGGERIAKEASSVGFAKNPIIAENPSDEAMLKALHDWAKK